MSHALAAGSRIGLIVEGDPDKAVIADWITRLLRKDLRILERDRRTLAPKPILIRRAPEVADALIESGCAHVVIVWDSAPFGIVKTTPQEDVARFWRECDAWDQERRAARRRPIDRGKLCPVPIIRELESWLLADEGALSEYLGSASHKVKVGRIKKPEELANPKKEINRIFQIEGRRPPYVDFVDAGLLARRVKDIGRLCRLGSFQELMANVGA